MIDVERVKALAAKEGYHTFRVQVLDISQPWNASEAFAKTVRKTKPRAKKEIGTMARKKCGFLKSLFGQCKRSSKMGGGLEDWHNEKYELEMYAYNTSQLHNQFMSIIANIKRKIKSKTYNPTLAPKLWMYWIDNAAKMYVKEFGGSVKNVFPKMVREQLAAEISVREFKKIMDGEYNY